MSNDDDRIARGITYREQELLLDAVDSRRTELEEKINGEYAGDYTPEDIDRMRQTDDALAKIERKWTV